MLLGIWTSMQLGKQFRNVWMPTQILSMNIDNAIIPKLVSQKPWAWRQPLGRIANISCSCKGELDFLPSTHIKAYVLCHSRLLPVLSPKVLSYSRACFLGEKGEVYNLTLFILLQRHWMFMFNSCSIHNNKKREPA